MTIIALSPVHVRTSAMHVKHDKLFEESQLIRMEALASLKEAGLSLKVAQELLKDASQDNPALTDMGEFTSFNDYLERGGLPFKRSAAYNYVKLADNWYIVEALGMQSKDPKSVHKSLRLCRTLKVIDWYLAKKKAGVDPATLSFELYWEEQEKPDGPTKKDLLLEVDSLRYQLENYKQSAVPQETYNYVFENYQRTIAELEQTKKELVEAERKLAELSPKPFTPLIFNQPPRTPVFS
jgi:DNA-binding transcriptional MerR regulator